MRTFLVLLVVAATLLWAAILPAQTPQQFGNWTYDSSFTIGATNIADVVKGATELHMNVVQMYDRDPNDFSGILRQTSFPGTDTNSIMYQRAYWKQHLLDMYNYGVKTIYSPATTYMVYDAVTLESHYNAQPSISYYDFRVPRSNGATLDALGDIIDFRDSLLRGTRVLSNGGDTIRMIAGDPRYTHRVLTHSGAQWYTAINHAADSLMFDVSFSIQAPPLGTQVWESVADTTAIAYADLFVRDTLQQLDSVAAIFRKIGRVNITKGMWFAASTSDNPNFLPAGGGFHDVSATIDLTVPKYRFALPGSNGHEYGWLWNIGERHSMRADSADSIVARRMAIADTTDTNWLPPGSFNRRAGNSCVAVEGSEFIYRFYTTGVVNISFARGRIGKRLYYYLRRGNLDSMIHERVGRVYANDTLEAMMGRFGIADEVHLERTVPYTVVNARVQEAIAANDDDRGIYTNPPTAPDAMRVMSGDFDSVRVAGQPTGALNKKILQMTARQDYYIVSPTPVTYANPDRMGFIVTDTLYRMNATKWPDKLDSTGQIDWDSSGRGIFGNSLVDHARYVEISRGYLGSYYDMRSDYPPHNERDAVIPALGRFVDVARFKYKSLPGGEYSYPIWSVIETHGYIGEQGKEGENKPYDRFFSDGKLIPTPEEIIVQCWAAAQCNANGIIFSDLSDDGYLLGAMRGFTGEATVEYGTLKPWTYDQFPPGNPPSQDSVRTKLDSMWIAHRSRMAAIREVTTELHRIDSIVGWKNLIYNQEQMSVHDTARRSFDKIPMVASVEAIRAKRHQRDTSGNFVDSVNAGNKSVDPQDKTYLEVTHFTTGPGDTAAYKANARLIMVTNRRLWPVDTATYSATTTSRFSSYAVCSSKGLGAIDVRKPRMVLKNSTTVIADKFIIEKVGHPEWQHHHDTVDFNQPVELDWLLPGRGALYRITPYSSGTNNYGVSFNGGTRSENPSTNSDTLDAFFVVERDSAIYLRCVAADGKISSEVLLSDPADLTDSSSVWNINPVIASVRDTVSGGYKPCLAVWERRKSADTTTTIEAIYIEQLPRTNLTPTTFRFRLTEPRNYLTGGLNDSAWMAPALTGVRGGWVASWANASNGIEVKAIRANPFGPGASDTSITLIARLRQSDSARSGLRSLPASTAYFPTLAYCRHDSIIRVSDWRSTTTAITSEDDPNEIVIASVPETYVQMQVCHLAYQQGTPHTANAQYIMYNRVGVNFDSVQPHIWISPTEHVSEALSGCGWLHPSIAVDSLRIGVSFQTNRWDDRLVTLRFRNTNDLDVIGHWKTTAFNWGTSRFYSTAQYYEWPSLTQFPAMPVNQLQLSQQPGALTWFRTKRPLFPAAAPSWQYIYRYGAPSPTRLPNGQYPTMMLVPYRKQNPIEFTSVLHRGDTTLRESRQSPRGSYNTDYYPPLLQTKRTSAAGIFGGSLVSNKIHAEFTIEPEGKVLGCGPYFHGTIGVLWDDGGCNCTVGRITGKAGWDGRDDKPPTFFPTPTGQEKEVLTLADAAEVTRTSTFETGTAPMLFERSYAGGIDLMSWLNGVPLDSNSQPADIKLLTEVVRDSDDAVLWSADTVSARDVGYDVVNEVVEVPVHTLTPGTEVYVRIRALASYTLEHDVSTAFTMWEDSTLSTYYKMVRPQTEAKATAGETPSPLEVSVIPNPLTVRGELWLRVTEPGRAGVGIYDMLGRLVKELPAFDAAHPGEYALELDLAALPKGTYTVRIEQGSYQASSRFTVVR